MRDFTKIEAWRLADDLTVAVYERTRTFPREELNGSIKAVEKEAGGFSKLAATISSLLVLGIARIVSGNSFNA